MEDQDLPTNVTLRNAALEKAIQMYSLLRSGTSGPAEAVVSDTLYVADQFYEFLKGDTK